MRKIVLLAMVACKWTEFDDLSNEAPAHSTTKPDVKSSDWGVALATAQTAGSGANVLVIGTDPPTFSTIVHGADGNTSLGQNAIDLNTQFAISSIPDPPILLNDPASDNVALVIPTLDGRILVEGGNANMPTQLGVLVDPAPLAATYVAMGSGSGSSPILVVGKGTINGTITTANMHLLDVTASKTTDCTVNDDAGAALNAIAMAQAPSVGTAGTLLVWDASGKLITYDQAGVFDMSTGCVSNQNTIAPVTLSGWAAASVDTGFVPFEGSIAVVGDHFAVLEGHGDPTKMDTGQVIVIDLDTGMPVAGSPLEADGVRGFAVGDLGSKTYLALGFPSQTATPSDGGDAVAAGTVEVREIDPTTGELGATIALQLQDAQPETNQKFGRTIAITNFGLADGSPAQPILVVGASNEIFSYYRTSIYDIGLK